MIRVSRLLSSPIGVEALTQCRSHGDSRGERTEHRQEHTPEAPPTDLRVPPHELPDAGAFTHDRGISYGFGQLTCFGFPPTAPGAHAQGRPWELSRTFLPLLAF